MKAHSSDEKLLPSFPQCEVPGVVLGDIQRRTSWPAFVGVDLAGRKRRGNAIVGVRLDPSSMRRYPAYVRYVAGTSVQVANAIAEVDRLLSPSVIKVENNGYQEALKDWITSAKDKYPFWLKIEETRTEDGNKHDAEKGLPGLEVEFFNRSWVFPLSEYEGSTREDPDPVRADWARLAEEISDYPIAASSDGLMALWFARQAIVENYGFIESADASGGIGDISNR